MNAAELNEIISFIGIGLLILAIVFIQLARRKLSGFIATLVSLLAYIFLIVGGILVLYIVMAGPTG